METALTERLTTCDNTSRFDEALAALTETVDSAASNKTTGQVHAVFHFKDGELMRVEIVPPPRVIS